MSCINEVQRTPFSLLGQRVLTAVIDCGIDYANEDFRNADGTAHSEYGRCGIRRTRNRHTAMPSVRSTHRRRLTRPLHRLPDAAQERIVPSRDTSGHGTAIAGIAAGNGRAVPAAVCRGGPASELVIVKLGNPRHEGFPRTTELMQGVDYAIRKSLEYHMPVAVNISFGNTYWIPRRNLPAGALSG